MRAGAECVASNQHTIEELGWSRSEAAETRARLLAFAEDWDDPSMAVYDTVIPSEVNLLRATTTASELRQQDL